LFYIVVLTRISFLEAS